MVEGARFGAFPFLDVDSNVRASAETEAMLETVLEDGLSGERLSPSSASNL
jgi:hypothetical protein